MARKRLTKGTNALRVEERIARVPADLSSPRQEGSGVFEALRLLGRESGESGGLRDDKPKAAFESPPAAPRAASLVKAEKPAPAKAAKAAPAPRRASSAAKAAPAKAGAQPAGKAEPRKTLSPESFTKAERRAIVVSCVEYRNRLPTYLRSAMREVQIIDSILKKCESAAEDGTESPEARDGSPGSGR